jgi:aminoglycoside phosphotransferase (APT) family kinase protein
LDRPWEADVVVDPELAAELVARSFPELAPVGLRPLGDGWDNTAYLVNDELVFRFPRRELAAPLMLTECALLPALAPALPLPVPVPVHVAPEGASASFPWSFSGYRLLAGRTACAADLDARARRVAAPLLGSFLRALHAFPADRARRLGAPPDTFGRLDLAKRSAMIRERLDVARERGLVEDATRWDHVLEDRPRGWVPTGETLVHGDLYARHVLVDGRSVPAGVIDWGDVHLGDPAVDLALAHVLLPPDAHAAFLEAYGVCDDDTWRVARLRALFSALTTLVYGADVGEADLEREARVALAHLAG